MHNHPLNHATCTNCTFSPFCQIEKNHSQSISQANVAVKQHQHLQKNEALFLPQNTFRNLYIIQQGAIKTFQIDTEGNELIRGFYFAGEILGLEAIYTRNYLCSAVALSETVVCEIPYDNCLELLQSDPALQKHFLNLMSQQLNINSYLFSIKAEQRLAAFLIDLSSRLHPCEKKIELLLPISRQDIGNYLRLTTETISRIFSRLKENKIISIDYKKIRFLQPETLKLIAGVNDSWKQIS